MRSLEKVLRQNWETEFYCEPWMEWYEAEYYLKQTLSDTREFLQDSRVRFDDALLLMSDDCLQSKATNIVRADRLLSLLTTWTQRIQIGDYLYSRPIDDRRITAKTSLDKITRHATVLHFLLLQLEEKKGLKDRKSLGRLIAKGDINLKDIDLSTILADDEDKDLLSEKYKLWRTQVLRQEAIDRVADHVKPNTESESDEIKESAIPGCIIYKESAIPECINYKDSAIPGCISYKDSAIPGCFNCFSTKTTDSLTTTKDAQISSYDDDTVVTKTKIKSCKKDKQKKKPWSSLRRAISSIFRLKL